MQNNDNSTETKFSLDFGLIVVINHWSQTSGMRYKVIP